MLCVRCGLVECRNDGGMGVTSGEEDFVKS